jgi:ribosomal protein S18 acetylase RimI-like enzyme
VSDAIRMATPKDAARLAELHAQCFDEAWDEAAFAAFLRDSFTFALIAGAARALIIVRVAADESEILTLGTQPGSRRLGLARALVETAGVEAQRRGARRMFLEVAADNLAAHDLYAEAGFAPVGRRPGYYIRAAGRAADAVILSAALPLSR